jgi:integrase/recombinase XerD
MSKNVRAIKKRDECQPVSIRDAASEYLASPHVKHLSPKTQTGYALKLRQFTDWCESHQVVQDRQTKKWTPVQGGPILLHEVTDQVVQCYLEYMTAVSQPAKPGASQISTYTLAGHVRVIKTFLNWCVLDEQYGLHVQHTAISRIKKPKVIEVIIDTFTDEQIAALFDACAQEESEHLEVRDRAILALLLDCGLRANELVTLRLCDVEVKDAKDAHVRILGKGSKWGEVGFGDQARRYLAKYIRMFREPTIEHKLEEQIKGLPARQANQVKRQLMQQERVFVNRAGKPLTTSGLYRLVARLGERAGIEGVRCSPHSWRHTFAVRFWRRTHDIRTLSKLLRHSSIAVTENYLKSILQSEARVGAPSVLDEL